MSGRSERGKVEKESHERHREVMQYRQYPQDGGAGKTIVKEKELHTYLMYFSTVVYIFDHVNLRY